MHLLGLKLEIYSVPKTLGTNEVKRQLALRVKKKARW